jgi:alpha-galactosidase
VSPDTLPAPSSKGPQSVTGSVIFPADSTDTVSTRIVLSTDDDGLPVVRWLGAVAADAAPDPQQITAAAGPWRGGALLVEHSRGTFTRPGLRGHRPRGGCWSTAFRVLAVHIEDRRLRIEALDESAGLRLLTDCESLAGGALRIRHVLTNVGDDPYLVDGLEVTVPLPDSYTEVLDFTGRHENERVPQRHGLADGLWVREGRRGKPGLDAASLLVAGTAGFTCVSGAVVAVHVGWSGNCVLRLERDGGTGATIGGGELLLPGELALDPGESYPTPWVYVVAADDGLDTVSAAWHTWLRSLPSHPDVQPVTLNVWEAVYFDHDVDRLIRLADLAAAVGAERFVLDDGWFHSRRHDDAGLGDWWVDPEVWPNGLTPLIDHVHRQGLQFGLWIEPEMVNPDSDLYREHPDWVLAVGGRTPLLQRNQLVLDLANPDAFAYLHAMLDAVLTENAVDYVKWDHNRDLLEAGTSTRGGAPAVHAQTVAYYELLDGLRRRHPGIAWESCAAGGGRIDLGVLERVQRVWTSDMTDALARQHIQRSTSLFVAPEYLGAHVSAPTSHQTGRTFTLDFRAATALFGAFGIEWDLTSATADELARLREWVDRFTRYRPLLHSGRVVRPDSADPAVLLHGVLAADRRSALLAHVQLGESAHNRGVGIRVPGLVADIAYEATWEGPVDSVHLSVAPPVDPRGPTGGAPVTGAVLATTGLWIPRRRPESVLLVRLDAV